MFRWSGLAAVLVITVLQYSLCSAAQAETPAAAEFAQPVDPAQQLADTQAADFDFVTTELDTTDITPEAEAAAKKPDAKPAKPKKKKKKPAIDPATTAYKPLFYDNDFKYLRKPGARELYFGDIFKQIDLPKQTVVDVGGELRYRDHHETKLRNIDGFSGVNLIGNSDDFLLQRTRLYTNVRVGEVFRFYGEMIDAYSSYQKHTPRNIELNRFDALNLFVEGRLLDTGEGELWARAGRQEMLYGAERLVSPLDWANTRRTFDGAKLYWKGEDWNWDAFWTRPVLFPQHLVAPWQFDHSSRQEFLGVYATYKGKKDHPLDLYFLRLADYNAPGNLAIPFNFQTNLYGGRWLGKRNDWLAEMEGGCEFGSFDSRAHQAAFATCGIGRQLSERCWKPTLWAYYDWASGDVTPGVGTRRTFNQLFPLSHKYFGFMDLVARQNISDVNFLATATPTKKTKLLAWYHIFHLDQPRDALYNAAGVPIRVDPTGNSGTYVGQEIDTLLTVNFSPRVEALFGYSYFFSGTFVQNTNPPGVSGNAGFYYSQWSWRF